MIVDVRADSFACCGSQVCSATVQSVSHWKRRLRSAGSVVLGAVRELERRIEREST
jgi:hypothetical protein